MSTAAVENAIKTTDSMGTDTARGKAMEEHRRLVKEHMDKESKLRDRTDLPHQ